MSIQAHANLKPGTPFTREVLIQKIETTFNEVGKNNIDPIDKFYHPDIKFRDPLGEIGGLSNMHRYYAELYKNVKSIRFDFVQHIVEGSRVASFWNMTLEVPGLNGGNPYTTPGMSRFEFDSAGLVTCHEDIFDMGAFIYEQIPGLKHIVGFVKQRLKH